MFPKPIGGWECVRIVLCSAERVYVQLVGVEKRCPQTLHSSEPIPIFFSIWTLTDPSWLQKRQLKTTGKGSF